jgi:hypothetical protein
MVALALVVGTVALPPVAAEAQRMGAGGRAHNGAGFSGSSHRGVHHGAPGARGFAHRRFGGVVVLAPPLFWYGSDWYGFDPGYAAAPAYAPAYAPSVAYAPAPGGSLTLAPPAPTAPPPPSVVELPTGRWELRGDGLNVPYRWVWIPNPPSAPPSAAPGGEPAAPGPSSRPEPPGHTRVYRWTDAEGTLHMTDRLDQVPERYRAQARAAKPS